MQQEYKDWIQGVFDRSADTYGIDGSSYFDKLGTDLVNFADLSNANCILDVATGKGAVLRAVAEKVDKQTQIFGIDLSAEMIKNFQSSAFCQRFNNVQLLQMDAEALSFPDDYFDIIFCAFGLFFFPNPEKALREFKRTLKKNGKLYFSFWDGETALDNLIQEKIKKLGSSTCFIANSLHSDTPELRQALSNSGFKNIKIKKHSILHSYNNAEEWWESLWSHAFRGSLEKLNNEQLSSLKQEALIDVMQYQNKQGLIEEPIPTLFMEVTT